MNDSSIYSGVLATMDEACSFITHPVGADTAEIDMRKRLEHARNELDTLLSAVELVVFPYAQTDLMERRRNLINLRELVEKQAEVDDDQEDPV